MGTQIKNAQEIDFVMLISSLFYLFQDYKIKLVVLKLFRCAPFYHANKIRTPSFSCKQKSRSLFLMQAELTLLP